MVQGVVLAFLLVCVCILLWVIFHIEPAGPKDYSHLNLSVV
jgi:hypothetical protein